MKLDEIILPDHKIAAETDCPENMIIFSKPKIGKTSVVAQLENCLLLDLERGSRFTSAMKLSANSAEEIIAIGKAIKAAGNPYKYIAVDTITALEDIAIPYAEVLYSKTSMGAKWFEPDGGKAKYGTIINMPQGAGYYHLRIAFEKLMNYIKTWAPRVIFLGHVKDIMLEKNGGEVNSLELDLIGKSKRIACAKADAIGYLYRKGDKNYISFKTSDEVSCGARPLHLKNQEFVLSELDEQGNYITHWDKIYID